MIGISDKLGDFETENLPENDANLNNFRVLKYCLILGQYRNPVKFKCFRIPCNILVSANW